MPSERLKQVIGRIDQLNSEDPNTELMGRVSYPRELVYSKRLSEWVSRLNPAASEELRIAARGQHIRRWTIPRSRYEINRRGYLRWREALKMFHAQTVAALMLEVGYPEAAIQRVRLIMGKRHLQHDPDTQTLEDALCLVFLQTQFTDLKKKTLDDTMREILRKTWAKMSDKGRAAALRLDVSEEEKAFIAQTLSLEQS
jgi:hypothetical protein